MNVAASSCGWGYFENAPHVDADIFLYGLKKIRFQQYPDTCGQDLACVQTLSQCGAAKRRGKGPLLCLKSQILWNCLGLAAQFNYCSYFCSAYLRVTNIILKFAASSTR